MNNPIWRQKTRKMKQVCGAACFIATFSRCSSHLIIMKLSGVVTIAKSAAHANGQGQRSKVKVAEVKTIFPQFGHFQTVTPVWIDRWLGNDAQSLKWQKRSPIVFFMSSVEFQGHTGWKINLFDPNWVSLDCNFSLNWQMATKWCTKLEVAFIEGIYQMSRSHGPKNQLNVFRL